MFNNGFPEEWSTLRKLAWLYRTVINAVSAVLKTVTGNPIHITDALARPAEALSVAVEPIQDLHGYDNPWPPGGGKNLCDGIFEQGAGNGSNTARIRQATPFPIKAGVTYTLSASDYTHYYYVINTGQTQNYPWADFTYCGNGEIWTQGSITFTATRDGYLGVIIRKPDNSAIAPSDFTGQVQVEVGSTPTSWTPYSNICPITGWMGLTVYHSGADTSDPTTIPITWQTEAGTVYGGTLDVTSGVLTVDRAMVDGGDLTWTKEVTNYRTFTALKNDALYGASLETVISSNYKSTSNNGSSASADNYVWIRSSGVGKEIAVKDTSKSALTKEEFKTAMTGVQFVYELATPIEVTLTPEEITLLEGENNLWSDAGDMTLTYLADGNASDVEALNILLGNRYYNNHEADEPTDREALNILLGGQR